MQPARQVQFIDLVPGEARAAQRRIEQVIRRWRDARLESQTDGHWTIQMDVRWSGREVLSWISLVPRAIVQTAREDDVSLEKFILSIMGLMGRATMERLFSLPDGGLSVLTPEEWYFDSFLNGSEMIARTP